MLVPVLGDFVNIPPSGGGSSVPGLPVWSFAGHAATPPDPASGKFTTDAATVDGTASIYVSNTPSGGVAIASWVIAAFTVKVYVVFTSLSTQKTYVFLFSPPVGIATYFQLTSGFGWAVNSDSWGGDFTVQFLAGTEIPGLASILSTSSITPCADGTVSPVTSITTVQGIITAIS